MQRKLLAAFLVLLSVANIHAPSSAEPGNSSPVDWTIASEGIVGKYYPVARPRGAAVLLLMGSEGGFAPPQLAQALVAAGHPVLALAYFSGGGEELPGVPKRLERVPLEYFDLAVERLKQVSRRPIAVIGESRGAEAALLIATRRKDIRTLIAFAPTSHVWQSPGTGGRRPLKAAWIAQGVEVPFAVDIGKPGKSSTENFTDSLAASDDRTRIKVERIHARTLLVAGEDDQIWPSVQMAGQIAAQMRKAGRKAEVRAYPNAGHLLMGPGPGLIRIEGPGYSIDFGGTEAGNLAARNDAWQRTLEMLSK